MPYFLGEWRRRLKAFYQSGQYTAVPISLSEEAMQKIIGFERWICLIVNNKHFHFKNEFGSIQKIIQSNTEKEFYNLNCSSGKYMVKRHTFNIRYKIRYKIN